MMNETKGMPAKLYKEKPTHRKLSPAMERLYDVWPHADDRYNEFFTQFKYSRISGIGKSATVSRRDPSKVVKVGDTYYVWYTRRKITAVVAGYNHINEEVPAVDWDMAGIWYATSKNGFDWKEIGPAVEPSEKGNYGDRTLSTPDILVYKGKYYLYYQTFTGCFSADKGDYCDVSMAWSYSPDGPWIKTTEPVLKLGEKGEWDDGSIHDPYPIVYNGKIWLFYKGQPVDKSKENIVRAQGVGIADSPFGPFIKPEMNPVLNSGHETFIYPYKEGIAAVLCVDGPEKNTIQYAEDGLSFNIMSTITLPPIAAGPFCPDAFADNKDGQGVAWGLSHISEFNDVRIKGINQEYKSFLVRFDCDLHRGMNRELFRNPKDQVGRFNEATFFQEKMSLCQEDRDMVEKDMEQFDIETI